MPDVPPDTSSAADGPPQKQTISLNYASNDRELERARVNRASLWLLGGVIVTPLTWLAAILGGARPNPWLDQVLFPYSMLSATGRLHTVSGPFFLLGIVQYPLYGFVLTMASLAGRRNAALLILSLLHGAAVAACFILSAQ